MSAAADGQIFRKTLDDAKDKSLKPIHSKIENLELKIEIRGVVALFFFVFGSEHNGADFDDQSDDNQNGSHNHTLAVEHSGVEDVGVVAAAAAQEDVSKAEQDDAGNQEDVVHWAESEIIGGLVSVVRFGFVVYRCGCIFFLVVHSEEGEDKRLIFFYVLF